MITALSLLFADELAFEWVVLYLAALYFSTLRPALAELVGCLLAGRAATFMAAVRTHVTAV
jgi:hypothetical protein